MKAEVKYVTPEMAKEILEKHNKCNRGIKQKTVDMYARDIKDGNWKLNGEAIQIDSNGELKNGQHRLNAIVKAGIPIKILVVTGVDPDVRIYDSGTKRSPADILRLEGYEKCRSNTTYVGIINFIYDVTSNMSKVSMEEMKKFISMYGDTLDTAYKLTAHKGVNARFLKRAPILAGMFFALECGYSKKVLEEFIEVAGTGFYNDVCETPAIVFRNMLLKNELCLEKNKERRKALHITEKALYDFSRKTQRKRAYSNEEQIYSSQFMNICKK